MARQRRVATSNWNGAARDEELDGMFRTMAEEAGKKLERDDISLGNEADALVVGLPLPALCLRYLFQSTVFPLSRITQITGEEGSCKSALLYEIFRWHFCHGGGAVFHENEGKDSPELRDSILQYNQVWLRRLDITPTHSLEEWQAALTEFVKLASDYQTRQDGPGRTIPIAFGIDSLMATAPREEIEKIMKSGHATRNFALAAYLISQYMRTMPSQLKTFPFSIIGTNHLKPATDYMGRPTSNIPGGKSVKFMETYEIEMKRAPTPDIDRLEYGGIKLKITMRKNSLGPSRKQIGAELLWWNSQDPVTRMIRQQTAWDWDTASIETLLSFNDAKAGKKSIYAEIMKILPLHNVNPSRREATCPLLGFDQATHFRSIGAALESRPDLLMQMYPIMGITPRRVFQPGVDYRTIQAQAIEESERRAQNLYQHMDDLPRPELRTLDPEGVTIAPEDLESPPREDEDDGMVS